MKLGNRKVVACIGMGFAMIFVMAFSKEAPNTIAETNQDETETNQYITNFAFVTNEITETIDATIEEQKIFEENQDAIAATIEAYNAELVKAQADAAASPWVNKVMANVEESVNIRNTQDENGEIVGKLYKGASGDILERGEIWTKISSGSVEGYVKNDYLAFESDAETIANRDGKLIATINTETLKIRKEPNEAAEVLDLAAIESTYTALSDDGSWVEIQYDSEITGYVSKEFVSVELILGKAISIEEELAAIKAAEEKAAAEAAAKKEEKVKEKSTTVETTTQAPVAASYDDVTLLGGLVQLEAGGESYEGKLAVASVVVNRLNSGFAGSISGVIYQPGQFPGANNGKLASILASGVSGESLNAASAALSGTNNVGGYTRFISAGRANYDAYGSYTVIGNHCFY